MEKEITLRDEIAMRAMEAFIKNPENPINQEEVDTVTEKISGIGEILAKWSYGIADEMLKQRSQADSSVG